MGNAEKKFSKPNYSLLYNKIQFCSRFLDGGPGCKRNTVSLGLNRLFLYRGSLENPSRQTTSFLFSRESVC